MKKIITLTILTLCISAYSFGQQTIQGGGFESWAYNSKYNYYEPDSSIFSTLNILDSVGSGVTVYRCDTAYAGNYSAKMVTSQISLLSVIIPGVIGTLKINWLESVAVLGIPYPYGTEKPVRFSGYYQSYPVSGDSSAAVILLSKWNTTTLKRDTLAYNRLAFHGTVSTWTPFDTLITYHDNLTIPDTMTILLLSCAGFNASNMFGSIGQIGSTALFDNVNLTGVTGIQHLLTPSMNVRLSPNPASHIMKIDLGSEIQNGYFEVYDAQGKPVKQISVSGNSGQMNVSDLSSGMYYYKLTENKKLLNTGSFVVTK